MKKILINCLLLVLLISCSNETTNEQTIGKFPNDQSSQIWELVAMSGSMSGNEQTTGDNMDWQEQYILEEDLSFTKSRKINNQTIEEQGSYRILTLSDGDYLEFNYTSNASIIGNCNTEAKEILKLEENDKLVGTWWACDGPGLFYDRVQ